MVAYLQKPEGSEAFHQIVDFLNASHIKYALIKNPNIYVSLIQQFWGTATARTLMRRIPPPTPLRPALPPLLASIDGQVKTITEASLRRHLKLEESDGITSLPNTDIFEQLALIGVDVDAGGAATTDIGLDAGQGSDRVEILENDLQQTKKVYSFALTKLILRVKKLEKKVKTNKARRRARIVISEDEDAEEDSSKQGRKISDIDKDPTISLVQPEQDMEYDFDVSIAKGFTTASEGVQKKREKRKDKGKAIMKEDESVQKKSKKQLEQERLGHEEAIRLQEQINEEENQRIARDAEIAKQLQEEFDRARQEQEVIAKADQAHDVD
ncbi:hypothetical protein Tco_0940475 [Tanacetum coccineum]|uniref:Xylulose kinase-1 n=1 Tax=Tanacetum coccineum TaxID=301880 RepID=A0ABQ5DN45_9ASTR